MLRKSGAKRIQTWFYDEDPNGIKVSEVPNTTIQAVFIPRNSLKDLKGESEVEKPGIYFLFGEDKEAYIGEAEVGYERLRQHASPSTGKSFWDVAVLIVSNASQDQLDKVDVKYLEHISYLAAMRSGTYDINQTVPTKPFVREFRRDDLTDIFNVIKVLLGGLGFSIFADASNGIEYENEAVQSGDIPKIEAEQAIEKVVQVETQLSKDIKSVIVEDVLYCKRRDAYATGKYVSDGFLVYKGALLASEQQLEGAKLKRQQDHINTFLANGVLEIKDGRYVLVQDQVFSSISAAAVFVTQRRSSGTSEWKDKNGITARNKIEQMLSAETK
ncbi:GIY-YIG nuclease family protein [Priestia megaterium]|uniref:GIY-YIG nuclease family protein n=1 Tax=Priestia megaterium TaxID=1404 RepID=UPI003CAEAD42